MNTIVLFTRATLTQEVGQGLVNILQKHFLVTPLRSSRMYRNSIMKKRKFFKMFISWFLDKKKARCQVF